MKRTLEIEFLLDNAKTKTLSLTDPKDDISPPPSRPGPRTSSPRKPS